LLNRFQLVLNNSHTFLKNWFEKNFNLIKYILSFRSNSFDLKHEILFLDWRQKIMLIIFWIYYDNNIMCVTSPIIFLQEYFENMYLCFPVLTWKILEYWYFIMKFKGIVHTLNNTITYDCVFSIVSCWKLLHSFIIHNDSFIIFVNKNIELLQKTVLQEGFIQLCSSLTWEHLLLLGERF